MMNVLSSELVDLLVRGGLLLAAVVLVGLALRGRSAAMLSCFWKMALVAVFLLPLVPTVWTLKQAVAEMPVKVVVEVPAAPLEKPRPNPIELAPLPMPEASIPLAFETVVQQQQVVREPVPVEASGYNWLPAILLLVWLLGALWVVGRWVVASMRFRKLWRQSVPAGDASLAVQFRQLAADIGLKRLPKLMTHDGITSPMAGGLLHARVLLPNDCARWEQADRRMVLMHELVHVRRHDALFHLVSSLVRAIHWPNPLAWLVARRFRVAAECAADDRVLESGSATTDYSRLLVEFARRQMGTPSPVTPSVASAMAKPETVESRVRRILDTGTRRSRPHGVVVAILAGGFACALLAAGGIALADSPKSVTEKKVGADSAEKKIENKLDEIVLPEVNFSDATLEEATEFCFRKSMELDPEGQGLNILISAAYQDKPRPLLNMQLQNIPLGELLQYMAEATDMELSLEPYSIVFRHLDYGRLSMRSYEMAGDLMKDVLGRLKIRHDDDPFGHSGHSERPANAKEWLQEAGVAFPTGATAYYEPLSGRLMVRQTSEGIEHVEAIVASVKGESLGAVESASGLRERMKKIVLPEVDFDEASLAEIFDYLRRRTADLSEDGAINFVVMPRVLHGGMEPIEETLLTLRLSNVPLDSVLKYVAEFSGSRVTVDPHAVVISPAESVTDRRFLVRAFPIRRPELRERLAEDPGNVRDWLEAVGVPNPDGASAYFEPVGNRLIVRNIAFSIDLIESLLDDIEKSGKESASKQRKSEPIDPSGGVSVDE